MPNTLHSFVNRYCLRSALINRYLSSILQSWRSRLRLFLVFHSPRGALLPPVAGALIQPLRVLCFHCLQTACRFALYTSAPSYAPYFRVYLIPYIRGRLFRRPLQSFCRSDLYIPDYIRFSFFLHHKPFIFFILVDVYGVRQTWYGSVKVGRWSISVWHRNTSL